MTALAERQTSTTPAIDVAGAWIVVPAFNESPRIGATLSKLLKVCSRIIVVDDGSSDHTPTIALRYPVWCLRHAVNQGQGAALQTGIDFALKQGAEYIITFDGDGQHSAEDIKKLLEPLQKKEADIVLGSRFLGKANNIPTSRRLLLSAAVVWTRLVSRIKITDTHNGLRAFSRHAAYRIRITQNRMAHASEIIDQITKQKLRYCEVPVTVTYTEETLAKGQSSWNALRIASQFLIGKFIR
ncbi:glycosyltransferase family 2 protein [Calycomorphotria hydatis]|uniref:Undecaprenyl-phosphate mannosyltransferase n=1 Tax=Calycomorphotria hydatis TaxID=2528027 RepID=A0A517TBT5_9PLAN|nr:glycosyltransferase family 2 protein [Calycomorphotria hydatis]QDT65836.1 Undecaprenyl-phosphate mannosyltransferase [Calycomorphotria hydatis]